jgi:nitrogen-specific signal transduction histidine kinase
MTVNLGIEANSIKKGLVIKMEWNFFELENERRPFPSSLVEEGIESIKSKLDFLSNEQNAPFLTSFFVDLIQRIKNNLASIKNYTQISRGKFSDREFGEHYYRTVTGDIEKMDMVLNSLLDYIKVHTPIRKMNTIHNIVEEVLKKHQAKLEEKGIKALKKFEKDLPETIVPDEQLKYIIGSVLQYAIALTPPNWNLGLLTRSLILKKEASEAESLFKKDGKYIEISVVFPGYQRPSEPVLEIAALQKEEASDLILRFVKEVVLRNQGTMKMGADEKKTKTYIFLRFPVERRKVVYYQSVN